MDSRIADDLIDFGKLPASACVVVLFSFQLRWWGIDFEVLVGGLSCMPPDHLLQILEFCFSID